MRTRIIQAKTLLGEGHATIDKAITFDFNRTGTSLNGIFMVENINEWFELDNACVGCNDTVTVKGWIYKNVAYKQVEDFGVDEHGNPVVWGPINHMTTRIPVQTCVAIEQEPGCRGQKHSRFCPEDKVEVKVEVSSCSNQLMGPSVINIPDVYPPLNNYEKLEEVACVNIKVRVYRYEEVEVPVDNEC